MAHMPVSGITASAAEVVISPWPTKLDTSSAVAVELCSRPVTATPATKPVARLPTLRRRTWRRLAPYTRSTPVRTMCVPQTSSAMAANRFSRVCIRVA